MIHLLVVCVQAALGQTCLFQALPRLPVPCCLWKLCLESLQSLARGSQPSAEGGEGTGEGTRAEQHPAGARGWLECVLGNDKWTEVIAAVCAFGGSFQGRKQPFPPLFSGQGGTDTVFCTSQGLFSGILSLLF